MRSTTGHTFGGYASTSWHSADIFINAAGCFLFLVENPHGDAPNCFECKSDVHAMNRGIGWGPIFGGGLFGEDLYITSYGSGSCTNFPTSYTDTLGRGDATFTGAEELEFTFEDYEVWAAAT